MWGGVGRLPREHLEGLVPLVSHLLWADGVGWLPVNTTKSMSSDQTHSCTVSPFSSSVLPIPHFSPSLKSQSPLLSLILYPFPLYRYFLPYFLSPSLPPAALPITIQEEIIQGRIHLYYIGFMPANVQREERTTTPSSFYNHSPSPSKSYSSIIKTLQPNLQNIHSCP